MASPGQAWRGQAGLGKARQGKGPSGQFLESFGNFWRIETWLKKASITHGKPAYRRGRT
jgi:hypothetical protein